MFWVFSCLRDVLVFKMFERCLSFEVLKDVWFSKCLRYVLCLSYLWDFLVFESV